MKRDYEIDPVRHIAPDEIEVCAPEDADAFGLYERLPPDEEGRRLASWIADYPTMAEAEAARRKLTRG